MPKVAKKVEKVCEICGKSFSVPLARAESAKTCSFECCGKLTAKRYEAARARKICPVCGTEFMVPKCHEERSVCCSRHCANKMPGRKRSTGENHYLWNGGKTIHSCGYLYVKTYGHPYSHTGDYVFEHRVVLETWIREVAPDHPFMIDHGGVKYLRPDISVHHINENKRDNRLANLIACTRAAHRAIHDGKAPMQGEVFPEIAGLAPFQPYRVTCACAMCGKEFQKKRSDVKRGSGIYCSRNCFNQRPRNTSK